jgi:hypothetical protein
MDKKVFKAVADRSDGFCENPMCKRWGGVALHKHHAFFGKGRRVLMESIETVFDLCWFCHEGDSGVHHNRELDLFFKRKATDNLLEVGWTKEQIMEKAGRWYGD